MAIYDATESRDESAVACRTCARYAGTAAAARDAVLRVAPDITPARLAAAVRRVLAVWWFHEWRSERAAQREQAIRGDVDQAGAAMAPPAPTVARFLRLSSAVEVSAKTFSEWLASYERGGVAALVDFRGVRRRARAGVDPALFRRLLQRVARGDSVAAADRALRPIAARDGWPWPSLRKLQQLVREARQAGRTNPHLSYYSLN